MTAGPCMSLLQQRSCMVIKNKTFVFGDDISSQLHRSESLDLQKVSKVQCQAADIILATCFDNPFSMASKIATVPRSGLETAIRMPSWLAVKTDPSSYSNAFEHS